MAYSVVTSSTGFDKGKHVWQVRGNKTDCRRQVGVVTNYNCANNRTDAYMNSKDVGKSYYYYGRDSPSLCSATGGNETKVQKCNEWKSGQTVTILLDLEEGKISFWGNENKLGTLSIEKNLKYYPALCTCHCQSNGPDYTLITL